MAEGIQKKIEYADLQFISSFAMEKILDFQIWEEPGEHARGNFRLLLSENETGINSMNAPIQLLGQGNTAGALFSGYPEKVEIKEERGYRIADIQAVSGTILLDQKKSNRVFQKKVQTYMGIASTVTADTEHSACILPGSDMRTGGARSRRPGPLQPPELHRPQTRQRPARPTAHSGTCGSGSTR